MHKSKAKNFARPKVGKTRKRTRKSRKRAKPGAFWVLERMRTGEDGCKRMRKPTVRTSVNTSTIQHMQKENRQKRSVSAGFWQGQKDLNPRHAVLEWMWESAPGSEEGTVLSSSCRKSQNGRCWFGAAGKFCGRSSSQIATDTIRQSSRICWMSTADSSFFSARAAASFSKNSRLAEMISFTLR